MSGQGAETWATRHVGRSWVGHRLEDECPCPKQPCGLVRMDEADPACTQHAFWAGKTIRQCHDHDSCPATTDDPQGSSLITGCDSCSCVSSEEATEA